MTPPNTNEELRPCPFCPPDVGDADPSFWTSDDGKSGPGCMSCGGVAETLEQWNTRPLEDALIKERDSLREERDRYKEALVRISRAKPDGLDHSLDVAIIERARAQVEHHYSKTDDDLDGPCFCVPYGSSAECFAAIGYVNGYDCCQKELSALRSSEAALREEIWKWKDREAELLKRIEDAWEWTQNCIADRDRYRAALVKIANHHCPDLPDDMGMRSMTLGGVMMAFQMIAKSALHTSGEKGGNEG